MDLSKINLILNTIDINLQYKLKEVGLEKYYLFIRSQIFFQLRGSSNLKVKIQKPILSSLISRLKITFSNFIYLIKFLIWYNTHEQPKTWLFSHSAYEEIINRKVLFKYYEEYLKNDKNSIVISSSNSLIFNRKKIKIQKLLPFYSLTKKKPLFDINKNLILNLFSEIIENNQLQELINIKTFEKNLIKLLTWEDLITKVLSKKKPKKIILVCHYTISSFAILNSAIKFSIPIIEIQHGSIVNYPPYTVKLSLNEFPIPDEFWSWDKESEVFAKHNLFHSKKVILTENLWHKYWESTDQSFISDQEKVLKNKAKIIILYTSVPELNGIPKIILQAIELSPSNFEWWIRLHPREKDKVNNFKSQIKRLQQKRIVQIDTPTTIPLPVVIDNINIHISSWSSSTIEVLNKNLPTIIIHEQGKARFSEYFNTSNFYFEKNDPKNIISLINNFTSK